MLEAKRRAKETLHARLSCFPPSPKTRGVLNFNLSIGAFFTGAAVDESKQRMRSGKAGYERIEGAGRLYVTLFDEDASEIDGLRETIDEETRRLGAILVATVVDDGLA